MQAQGKRVLFVTTTLNVGGAEVMLVELVRHLVARGYRVGVASLAGAGVYGETLRELGATLFTAGSTLQAATLASRAVSEFAPDVVHGWMYHGNVAAWLGAKLRMHARPLLWTVHQSLYDLKNEKPRTRIFLRASRAMSTTVEHITYVSGTSREQHHAFGYSARSDSTIANGFDVPDAELLTTWRRQVRAELGIADGAFVVGQVARYHPMKNHLGMLRIAARVAASTDLQLLLLGDGLDASNTELANAIDTLGVRPCVRLLGRRSDTRQVMAALDALCVPSLWGEAFPMVMGEAMTVGVACVASDIGDSRELVRDVGHLVTAGDEATFADRLVQMARRSPEASAAEGQRARAFIEANFGLREVAARYERLYEQLARGQAVPAVEQA
jgi:glycosyltransferase involved in cell wall biosynthesis